jgi:hypothetical protein
MTIAHYQTTVNRIKELLNHKNQPPKTVRELMPLGEDISELLSKFHLDYMVFDIGEALIIKSALEGKVKRWIFTTRAEIPYWRELMES